MAAFLFAFKPGIMIYKDYTNLAGRMRRESQNEANTTIAGMQQNPALDLIYQFDQGRGALICKIDLSHQNHFLCEHLLLAVVIRGFKFINIRS